jgi:hypothetical protein
MWSKRKKNQVWRGILRSVEKPLLYSGVEIKWTQKSRNGHAEGRR